MNSRGGMYHAILSQKEKKKYKSNGSGLFVASWVEISVQDWSL